MNHKKTIGFEIRTLSNLIKRQVDNSGVKKRADHLTGVHGWVIGYLYHHQHQDIFQRDIEEEFSVRRSTVTAILQLMEKNGLITRESVPYDARLKQLRLTPKGKELHEMVTEDIEKIEKLLTTGISEEELSAFFATLEKMKRNIE